MERDVAIVSRTIEYERTISAIEGGRWHVTSNPIESVCKISDLLGRVTYTAIKNTQSMQSSRLVSICPMETVK